MRINPANLLSLSRVFLALLAVWVLFGLGFKEKFLIALAIVIIAVITDSIDGRIARHFGFDGEIGALSDRYSDHIFANILWISFAVMGAISFWVPVIMVARDSVFFWLKDAATVSVSIKKHTRLEWLSHSRFMRASYMLLKMSAWCGILIIAYTSSDPNILWPLVWLTVIMGVTRLVPNISSGWRSIILLKNNSIN